MKQHLAIVLSLLCTLGAGHALAEPIVRGMPSCLKLPPSQERQDCIEKHKRIEAGFDKEYQKLQSQDKRKKDDLCFTRRSTHEVVCPN